MPVYMVLQLYGNGWGIPYREPHAGPFDSKQEALNEIKRYQKQEPEETTTFAVFECVLAK